MVSMTRRERIAVRSFFSGDWYPTTARLVRVRSCVDAARVVTADEAGGDSGSSMSETFVGVLPLGVAAPFVAGASCLAGFLGGMF
jgi:hypothetical protein